jgi:uncharacterized protein YeaO (DUF488 family)
MGAVRVRRVYDSKERTRGDGARVLVDRLWPRGVSTASLEIDRWEKDVAPSAELRTWYGHRPERFREFSKRYRRELRDDRAAAAIERLKAEALRRPVTLLTATKAVELSAATVLAEALQS